MANVFGHIFFFHWDLDETCLYSKKKYLISQLIDHLCIDLFISFPIHEYQFGPVLKQFCSIFETFDCVPLAESVYVWLYINVGFKLVFS